MTHPRIVADRGDVGKAGAVGGTAISPGTEISAFVPCSAAADPASFSRAAPTRRPPDSAFAAAVAPFSGRNLGDDQGI